MTDAPCSICGTVTEVWECLGCDQLACEDCFAPMSPMATDPVTNCVVCTGEGERRAAEEADRESDRVAADRARKDARNAKARERYWRPENIRKRRIDRAERKRLRAEANLRNLVESLRIVGGMM